MVIGCFVQYIVRIGYYVNVKVDINFQCVEYYYV